MIGKVDNPQYLWYDDTWAYMRTIPKRDDPSIVNSVVMTSTLHESYKTLNNVTYYGPTLAVITNFRI